jgi:hypothetical protein
MSLVSASPTLPFPELNPTDNDTNSILYLL